jgi:energy-coupling factor transport system permease protein
MALTVPFGQYVPGDSPVHRLDPRVKLALVVAYTVLLFASRTWPGLAFAGVLAAVAIVASGVPVRLALRGLRPVGILLLFTIAVNALRTDATGSIAHLGPVYLSLSGLLTGLYFATRIVELVVGTSLVTLTTSPVALTDAMSTIMRPLDAVRVPVDDVAMMFSIALRFIPTTAEEAERLVVAQTARGARFDEGGPVKRARAWLPVLVPLFVRLFRRADDLAIAMESRCYTGRGRTRLRELRMRGTDWAVLLLGVTAATLGVILL